ncbi:hypothetical protein ACJX0J_021269 [Zea mays]
MNVHMLLKTRMNCHGTYDHTDDLLVGINKIIKYNYLAKIWINFGLILEGKRMNINWLTAGSNVWKHKMAVWWYGMFGLSWHKGMQIAHGDIFDFASAVDNASSIPLATFLPHILLGMHHMTIVCFHFLLLAMHGVKRMKSSQFFMEGRIEAASERITR